MTTYGLITWQKFVFSLSLWKNSKERNDFINKVLALNHVLIAVRISAAFNLNSFPLSFVGCVCVCVVTQFQCSDRVLSTFCRLWSALELCNKQVCSSLADWFYAFFFFSLFFVEMLLHNIFNESKRKSHGRQLRFLTTNWASKSYPFWKALRFR